MYFKLIILTEEVDCDLFDHTQTLIDI